jgi:hypothetical protein
MKMNKIAINQIPDYLAKRGGSKRKPTNPRPQSPPPPIKPQGGIKK